MKLEAEERKLHWLAKVHHFLEMWQGSQIPSATQKKSCIQSTQMPAVGYISDTEVILKASWSNFEHNCVVAFELLERSLLPPALSAKDFSGGWTQVWNVNQINTMDCHPVECNVVHPPESILHTEICLHWICNLDNRNDNADNWKVDDKSNVELDNAIEDVKCQEQWEESAIPIVPRLVQPPQR